jgi:hypothetical protein
VKKLSDKFTKKFDLIGIEEKVSSPFLSFLLFPSLSQAKERFSNWIIEIAIQEMRDRRQSGIEERAREIRRKEFEIITNYGARNTRYLPFLPYSHPYNPRSLSPFSAGGRLSRMLLMIAS